MTTKRAAIYARVSTHGQTTDNQIEELKRVAEHSGWTIVDIYVDQGISGAKARDKRPAFDRMCLDATQRKMDIILAWSVDRLGRSLQHLLSFLGEIHANNVDLYLHQQGINTITPAGKAMFQMCGVFAEFERAMIQERVKTGLTRAKAQGKILGRPKIPFTVEHRVIKLRGKGKSIRQIAREASIGASTVQRILAKQTVKQYNSIK